MTEIVGEALSDVRRLRLSRLLHRVADRFADAHRQRLHAMAAECAEPPDEFHLGDVWADVERRRQAADVGEIEALLAVEDDLRVAIAREWWSTAAVLTVQALGLDVLSAEVAS